MDLKGKKVAIYEDPFTRQVMEGEAVILEQYESKAGDLVYGLVEFPGHEQVERWFKATDVVEEALS